MNPFLNFAYENQAEEIFLETINAEPVSTYTMGEPLNENRIKRRRIRHKRNFGRGANHPSFFLRKFFSKLTCEKYQKIYEDYPHLYDRISEEANHLKTTKKRFNLDDLSRVFGDSPEPEKKIENYLNSKMFYQAVSDLSLEMIMEESKCSQILNHLISIEKYSARLGNPYLTGRVEFQ
jgi:hypothetical protein